MSLKQWFVFHWAVHIRPCLRKLFHVGIYSINLPTWCPCTYPDLWSPFLDCYSPLLVLWGYNAAELHLDTLSSSVPSEMSSNAGRKTWLLSRPTSHGLQWFCLLRVCHHEILCLGGTSCLRLAGPLFIPFQPGSASRRRRFEVLSKVSLHFTRLSLLKI